MVQFVEFLNGLGRWLVAHLWPLSIELGVLAVVVTVVLYLLRVKSPVYAHLFWVLVLAKPTTTFLVASPVSFYGLLPHAHIQAPEPSVLLVPAEKPFYKAPAPRVETLLDTRRAAFRPTGAWGALDRYGAVGLVWVVAAGVLGMRLFAGCVFVAYLRKRAIPQPCGRLYDALQAAARSLGLRRKVRICTSDGVKGPVLTGILRPVVLFPAEVAASLSFEQLRLIVIHELAHMRRADNLTLVFQRVTEILLFFHPAVWLCGRAIRREAENACDDAVVAATGRSVPYVSSLIRVVEARNGLSSQFLVHTFAATESFLCLRIRRILEGRIGRTTRRSGVIAAAAFVAIAALGLPTATARLQNGGDEAMPGMLANLVSDPAAQGNWLEILGDGVEVAFHGRLLPGIADVAGETAPAERLPGIESEREKATGARGFAWAEKDAGGTTDEPRGLVPKRDRSASANSADVGALPDNSMGNAHVEASGNSIQPITEEQEPPTPVVTEPVETDYSTSDVATDAGGETVRSGFDGSMSVLSAQPLDEDIPIRLPFRTQWAYSLTGLRQYARQHAVSQVQAGQPVYVYFEVLDLWRNASGETRYQILCEIEPVGVGGAATKGEHAAQPVHVVQGGKKQAFACNRVGKASNEGVFIKLDIPDTRPGVHRLRLKIIEEETGKYVTGTRTLEIASAG